MYSVRAHLGRPALVALIALVCAAAAAAGADEFHPRILGAHDFIVPESALNACQIRYHDPGPDARAVLLVENRFGETVRRFSLRPSARAQLLRWDGCDREGNPLSEADAPYAYRLQARAPGGSAHTDAHGGIGLREWGISQSVIDPPKDGFASGIDLATITPDLVKLMLSLDGGPRWIARHLDVEEVGKGARITPLHPDGRPFCV
ncbi:MAG: hypothetical protein ACOX9R_06050 [Armatimonadota bacterium]